MDPDTIKLLICGSGNGAHAFAGIASSLKDMKSCIIISLSLLALAQQMKATQHCSVDVTFIIATSDRISQANFQQGKEFIKQAALKLNVAPGQNRAAILEFGKYFLQSVTFGQSLTKKEFQETVDKLARTDDEMVGIDQALRGLKLFIATDSKSSGVRRIAILLVGGEQVIKAEQIQLLKEASIGLRKLGVRLLVVIMGTLSSELERILKLVVVERDENLVTADHVDDLLIKLPRIIACGSCVCTNGDTYITIDNYKSKKNRAADDIRFEFKSDMNGPGMIMSAQGGYVDYLYVGYENRLLWYNINLGEGEKKTSTCQQLKGGNTWHKVHLTRIDQSVKINTKNASTVATTPGTYNRLDLPSSKAYFLGAPKNKNMPPNFVGCIRYFSVDGFEPIMNRWENKPDSSIHKGSVRLCSASDESQV